MSLLPPSLRQLGVETAVRSRLRALRSDRLGPNRIVSSDRASVVSRAFADAVLDDTQPFIVATTDLDPGVIVGGIGDIDVDITLDEMAVVSPLVPFLRWDPVPPPAIVSCHGFTAGESLRQLVVRSGVTQDLDTLEITVTPPDVYGPDHSGLGYRETSERHLAPPKTSQSEAELHEAFDDAIGSTNPADHQALLGVALREAGTLFDVDVPRLDDPSTREPQLGIALLAGPEVPVAELKTLPLPKGRRPSPVSTWSTPPQLTCRTCPMCSRAGSLWCSRRPVAIARSRSRSAPRGSRPGISTTGRNRSRSGWCSPGPVASRAASTARAGRRPPPGDVQRFRLASSLTPPT